jgi:hypothetical protein
VTIWLPVGKMFVPRIPLITELLPDDCAPTQTSVGTRKSACTSPATECRTVPKRSTCAALNLLPFLASPLHSELSSSIYFSWEILASLTASLKENSKENMSYLVHQRANLQDKSGADLQVTSRHVADKLELLVSSSNVHEQVLARVADSENQKFMSILVSHIHDHPELCTVAVPVHMRKLLDLDELARQIDCVVVRTH